MPGQSDRPREARKRARRLPVVARGLREAIARVRGVGMLDVEERTVLRQLVGMVPEELLHRRLARVELRTNEHHAFYPLHEDLFVLLAEEPLPRLLDPKHQALLLVPFLLSEMLDAALPHRYLVVAGNEHLLDGASVGAPAAGEDEVPHPREYLHLGHDAGVDHVAREHDCVDALRVEPPEGLLQVHGLIRLLRI